VPEWISVALAASLPPGRCRGVTAAGIDIVLVNVDGDIHALDNTCPHQGGPLSEGHLEGAVLTCPWHGWPFDVRTRAHARRSDIALAAYDVRVVDGRIEVSV
jgi:nitrite reductase/ring-hydroxylating ferredoxin subunit